MTIPSVSKISLSDGSVETMLIRPENIPEVAEFDKEVFGADRTDLITFLYQSYPEIAWIIRENNRIAGFCLGRRGSSFTQIGPVYALSASGAKALIQSAVNQMTGQAVVVDIPADKSDTKGWLEACGFISLRSFNRMYLYDNPHPGIMESQYLICGPELG